MLAEQTWEYCQLYLTRSEVKPKDMFRSNEELVKYDTWIRYHFPDGWYYISNLSNQKEYLTFNLFSKAVGLLGGAGWELVSIQHCIDTTITAGWVRWSNCVAYFQASLYTEQSDRRTKNCNLNRSWASPLRVD
jgi:hypothetical protein